MKIPKIIHQIWSGVNEPLPRPFKVLSETWKSDYPTWQYEFWDNARINDFIAKSYPEHWDVYSRYPFNIQRWDAIRYLILGKIGGMYVDFDYESVKPMDELIAKQSCCFAQEKELPDREYLDGYFFNNALMLSIPNHPFMEKIIKNVFHWSALEYDTNSKFNCVFNTTGPSKIMKLYKVLSEEERSDIYLIPPKYVSPFTGDEAYRVRTGVVSDELDRCLDDAYAVHYFCSNWVTNSL